MLTFKMLQEYAIQPLQALTFADRARCRYDKRRYYYYAAAMLLTSLSSNIICREAIFATRYAR